MIKNKFLLLRRQKGLSVEEVCSATGIAISTLTKYEDGGRFPAEKTLKKIADFYGVDMSFFNEGGSFAPAITIKALLKMNGEPVWYYKTRKWYLVNSKEKYIINSTGEKIKFNELNETYLTKEPKYVDKVSIPIIQEEGIETSATPLKPREILTLKQVYVEVISSDEAIAKQLSGIYDVVPEKDSVQKGDIKFSFRNLGKNWLAFSPEAKNI